MRAWLILSGVSLAILLSVPAQYLGRQQDDLLYIIASQALSEGGYRLLSAPGLPPLTMVIPGLPVLLLPVTFLARQNFLWHQLFCALIMASSPWLFWLWLKTRCGRTEALLLAALFGTSPLVLAQAGTVMSEGPYLILVFALLFALERRRRVPAVIATLLLCLTQLRPAGLSLLPAALKQKKWSEGALITAIPAAALAVWSYWSWQAKGNVQESREFWLSYRGQPWHHLFALAFDNARFYLMAWGSCYLPVSWGAATSALALGALLLAIVIKGMTRAGREPAILMLAAGLGMHAVWGWQYERYLIPLLPWLLWAGGKGLGPRARPVLAVLLAAQLLFHLPYWVGRAHSRSQPELAQTYDWIKFHTDPAAILASPFYVRDGYYAARPSLPLPDSEQPQEFAGRLKRARARYVLWQEDIDAGLSLAAGSAVQRKLNLVATHLHNRFLFHKIYENSSEKTALYEIN
ncbi:MAG: hypothetical protein A3J74_03150 [Elusimicrobia bacterium RIFCSPHIGHO2_02_FULL_57_9]|nr:MAG: hypothetical protein A3J74_03150 [Elusimicrobia bacterium RIFCSPHIGHO2_02_FULL_57_9]